MCVYQKTFICLLALATAGCSLFKSDKPVAEGERIAVLTNETVVKPDVSMSDVKIALPRPHKNTEWTQNGGTPSHLVGHLESDNQLRGFWQSSFGTGSSKRDFLISTPVISHKVVFTIDAEGKVSAKRLDSGETI